MRNLICVLPIIVATQLTLAPLIVRAHDDDTPRKEVRIVGETISTALYELKRGDQFTLALAAVTDNPAEVKAVVSYVDERGDIVHVERGIVSPAIPSFFSHLPHRALGRIDSAFIRMVIALEHDGNARQNACGVAISTSSSEGPLLAAVGRPCQCGVSGGTNVSAQCETTPSSIGTP